MSLVMDQNGNIPDSALYFKCREDEEWMYHYRRFIEFKSLKERFDRMCFEEYEQLSLREEKILPGAYCKVCGKFYTFQEFDTLKRELVYPVLEFIATYTVCDCGNHEWKFVR